MTRALVVSPQKYAEYLRDPEFWHADYNSSRRAKDLTFQGYSPEKGMGVYIHTALTKAWGIEEQEVSEERLLLALSLEDSAESTTVDEEAYWTARINLMGWELSVEYDKGTFLHYYRARRGRREVAVAVTAELDPRLRGFTLRKIAYSVWREWAPTFIWLPDQDSNLEPSG